MRKQIYHFDRFQFPSVVARTFKNRYLDRLKTGRPLVLSRPKESALSWFDRLATKRIKLAHYQKRFENLTFWLR